MFRRPSARRDGKSCRRAFKLCFAAPASVLLVLSLGCSGEEAPDANVGPNLHAPDGGNAACTRDTTAFDFPGNGLDEDCSGVADDADTSCDQGLAIDSLDASHAANALGVCRKASAQSYGLISAKYVLPNGVEADLDPLHHGLLRDFGANVKPREGNVMLALSSGTARDAGDPDFRSPYGDDIFIGPFTPTPSGFPLSAPSCALGSAEFPIANDPVALELVLRTPSNANVLRFDFDFYSYEYPMFVCSAFNDQFVALVSPAPNGSQYGNVAFDSAQNPVSVNNDYLEVCEPQNTGGKRFACALGTADLKGTGYDELEEDGPHAATGWLVARTPVPSGQEIRIRFALWDAGDWALDSLVLLDHLSWEFTTTEFSPSTTRATSK
jgi:hypothetical protein